MVAQGREDVVVIGGGAVGVCCAYSLAREGRSVLLLERDELCAGSSWGNAGLLTTSSCAPEAGPGVIGQAARWLVDRDGPFRIRPRLDPRFVRWLWRFRAHCNADAALAASGFLRDRVRENTALVAEQARTSSRDFGFRRNGVLVLFASAEGLAQGVELAEGLRELEIPSTVLDPDAVARVEPGVTDAVVGGVLYPEDAHVDPRELVEVVADLARAHGARVEEGRAALGFRGAHRIEEIETTQGTIRPELVVLANGAWAPKLAADVGVPMLVEPGRGFSLTYDAGAKVFERPLRLWEVRTVVSSMHTDVRVTSKLDLVGLDTRVRERRVRVSTHQASRFVALPPGATTGRMWAGLRPLTPDGLPLIGRAGAVDNLVLATGHGHLGISLGAVTGEAVARIAAGDAPDFDPAPVLPERFRA